MESITYWLFLEKEFNELQEHFELIFGYSFESGSEDYWEWINSNNNEINIRRPHDYELGIGLHEKPIEIRINKEIPKELIEVIGNQLFITFHTDIYQGFIEYHSHKEFSLYHKRVFR